MKKFVGKTFEEFKKCIDEVKDSSQSILILSCDNNNWDVTSVNEVLKTVEIPVVGGVFPAIINKKNKLEEGFIIASLDYTLNVNICEEISTKENFEDLMTECNVDFSEDHSAFIFVDGLAKNKEEILSATYDEFGGDLTYFGGGAGSLSFNQKPCLYTNHGLIADSFVFAVFHNKGHIGVQHGWKKVGGPFQITASQGNIIEEIDYKPALEVYGELVGATNITSDNFFDIAKSFPFGLKRLGDEIVVRDPLTIEGTKIICVADVPKNSYVDLLSGNKEELISAARQASHMAQESCGENEVDFVFFVDCISRVLFMGDDYCNELEAVDSIDDLIGVLSLGEIANSNSGFLEFYNKTAVIARIEK